MKKKIIYTMLALTMAIALVAGGTMAWFTSEANAGETTFTAGTLHVGVTEGLSNLIEVAPKIENMNPGDVYDAISIVISNDGTKNLAWVGDWVFTPVVDEEIENADGYDPADYDKLLDAIYIHSMKMEFLSADGTPWSDDQWLQGHYFIQNGVGNDLGFNGGEAAAFNRLIDETMGVITLRNWNDNNTMLGVVQGSGYEHMGALRGNSSNKYKLTVQFGFHSKADNDFQGDAPGVAPIKVEFQVDATQVHADALNSLYPGLGTTHYNWFNNQINAQP